MKSKRREFWKWFTANQVGLMPKNIDPPLIAAINMRILGVVGEVAWEIGPFGEEEQFLAISPSSDDPAENEVAKLLIQEAPALAGWHFRSFKPPREWQLFFELDVLGDPKQIEGSRWEVLVACTHGQWDVIFKPDESCAALPASTLRTAAFTILDGELGEEERRRLIWDADVVSSWSPTQKAKAVRLEVGLLRKLLTSSRPE